MSSIITVRFSVFCCVLFSTAQSTQITDEFIDLINSKQSLWTAGHNFPRDMPIEVIKRRLLPLDTYKSMHDEERAGLPVVSYDEETKASLPENFDPRIKWPDCPSLNEIRDQGCCGSCWAFGAVTAMTDRVCIYSNATQHFHFSAEDMVSCVGVGGCDGGATLSSWEQWVHYGIVSGGNYNSSEGCRPYTIEPFLDHAKCVYVNTPKCVEKCIKGYPLSYEDDKKKGKSAYVVNQTDIRNIMVEVYKNGPVEVDFTVYKDFLTYKKGVYKHLSGEDLGGHAVKLLGWGVENGVKYWLLANSWNTSWGDNGFFKFLRGEYHCGIESFPVAGEPLL